ncbi:MAG: hypothetical protein WCX28_08655 [Bacteriovoracaceae bacterium]
MLRKKVKMVRRGAETAVILGKSFAVCSEGIPAGKDALKDDVTILACALLTMTVFLVLRNVSYFI